MSQQSSNVGTTHLGFESLILEAFLSREKNSPHWADSLIHVVPHNQTQSLAYHHQHSQYHLVLFWLENYFSQAARWMGVRELARLALDFLEQSHLSCVNAELSATQFLEFIGKKKHTHQNVSQLESLMRCGFAYWNLSATPWNPELAEVARDKKETLSLLLENKHAAFVASDEGWSLGDLWTAALTGKPAQMSSPADVLLFFRKNEFQIDFEAWPQAEFNKIMSL
jgi:hypothetical protein